MRLESWSETIRCRRIASEHLEAFCRRPETFSRICMLPWSPFDTNTVFIFPTLEYQPGESSKQVDLFALFPPETLYHHHEERQNEYPGPTQENPKKKSKRRRARIVERRKEVVEYQNCGRVVKSFLFSPSVVCQTPPHPLRTFTFCQSNSAAEDRPRTFTKKSVEHSVFRSNGGLLFLSVIFGTALLSFSWRSSCSPFSPSIVIGSHDILTSRRLVLPSSWWPSCYRGISYPGFPWGRCWGVAPSSTQSPL